MDEQFLYIDSRLGQTPNNYTVHLTTPLKFIKKVDLVSAIIPYNLSEPYIFLDIEQFRSRYGTQSCKSNLTSVNNKNLDTSPTLYGYFGHVLCTRPTIIQTKSNIIGTSGNTITEYTYSNTITYIERQYTCSVTFKQPIESVDKLTIRWVDRFNNPVVFTDNHSFILRVHTVKHEIDDYTPLKRPDPVEREQTYTDVRLYLLFIVVIMGIFTILMLRGKPDIPVEP